MLGASDPLQWRFIDNNNNNKGKIILRLYSQFIYALYMSQNITV